MHLDDLRTEFALNGIQSNWTIEEFIRNPDRDVSLVATTEDAIVRNEGPTRRDEIVSRARASGDNTDPGEWIAYNIEVIFTFGGLEIEDDSLIQAVQYQEYEDSVIYCPGGNTLPTNRTLPFERTCLGKCLDTLYGGILSVPQLLSGNPEDIPATQLYISRQRGVRNFAVRRIGQSSNRINFHNLVVVPVNEYLEHCVWVKDPSLTDSQLLQYLIEHVTTINIPTSLEVNKENTKQLKVGVSGRRKGYLSVFCDLEALTSGDQIYASGYTRPMTGELLSKYGGMVVSFYMSKDGLTCNKCFDKYCIWECTHCKQHNLCNQLLSNSNIYAGLFPVIDKELCSYMQYRGTQLGMHVVQVPLGWGKDRWVSIQCD